MVTNNKANRLRPDELHIDRVSQPEWPLGTSKQLVAGDVILCTAGLATVVKVCGKTSDGSKLLELKLIEGDKHPFYASAANVLVRPPQSTPATQMIG